MEMNTTPIIENWNLCSYGMDVILRGTVYGHSRINDGRQINTSPLVKVSLTTADQILLFHTQNTVYRCPLVAVDPSCQMTKKYLLETLPEEHQLWDKWLNNDPARPITPFENIPLPVPDGSYLLALDPERPYLFGGVYQKNPEGYHWTIRQPVVHLGMYTDSVICKINNPETMDNICDVRYFPQGCQQVRFYEIDLQGEVVPFYVVNVGRSEINYEQNILKPWHYFQLLEDMLPQQDVLPEEEPKSQLPPEKTTLEAPDLGENFPEITSNEPPLVAETLPHAFPEAQVESPVVETPVVEAPIVETPVVEAPIVETPVAEAPIVETPVVEAPVVESPIAPPPIVETPVAEAPVVESPVAQAPIVETPVVEAPIVETPQAPPMVAETLVAPPIVESPVAEAPIVETPLAPPMVAETLVAPPIIEETPVPPAAPLAEQPVPATLLQFDLEPPTELPPVEHFSPLPPLPAENLEVLSPPDFSEFEEVPLELNLNSRWAEGDFHAEPQLQVLSEPSDSGVAELSLGKKDED